MSSRVWTRRAYDPPGRSDGVRVLVDRLWPRGISRDDLEIDMWLRDVAPSDELRRWYGHDVEKWEEFRRRYRAELEEEPAASALGELAETARQRRITLVFAAKDVDHCNAIVLEELLTHLVEGAR